MKNWLKENWTSLLIWSLIIIGVGFLIHYSSSDKKVKVETNQVNTPKTSNTSLPRYDDPTETRSYNEYGDMDCTDFSSQSEAQEFFEENGGPDEDYHNLDRDGDGLACESN